MQTIIPRATEDGRPTRREKVEVGSQPMRKYVCQEVVER